MREHPTDGWNLLRQAGGGDGRLEVPSRPTGVETGFGPARFALGPAGEPRLLVPCSAGIAGRDLGTTSKLDVSVIRYQVDGKSAPFVDITCTDRNLDAVFAELAGEVLERLEAGRTPEEATAGTIADFRDLLFADAPGEASRAAIIGLLGELLVLGRLAEIDPAAISSWTGPFSERQDFRREFRAIEVKTSSRSDATEVRINGSDQLLEPKDGSLVLVHVRIEQSDVGTLRVAGAFDRLVELGVDHRQLLSGLAEFKCVNPADASWNRFRFELQGISAYRVGPGFPRIVPGSFAAHDVPQGTGKLKYSVDLASASGFRMGDTEFEAFLADFVA